VAGQIFIFARIFNGLQSMNQFRISKNAKVLLLSIPLAKGKSKIPEPNSIGVANETTATDG
jgi:hypothetical protein